MEELHNKNTTLVKDIIIGMSDGLTVPFALTAGLSGVLDTNHLIIVSGLAEITAGCISMGLGGFLAGQSEVEHYDTELQREYSEIELKNIGLKDLTLEMDPALIVKMEAK